MRRGRKGFSLLLAVCMALLCAVPAGAAETGENTKRSIGTGLTSVLVDHVDMVAPEAAARGGVTPTAYKSFYTERLPESTSKDLRADSLPAAYDLRDEGRCTTVKDQNPWGSCWAFGALSSLESNILTESGVSGSSIQALPDYSEHQLAWFTYEPQDEITLADSMTGDSQVGEGTRFIVEGTNQLDRGGNSSQAAAFLASWQGAADETSIPYQNAAGTLEQEGDWSLEPSQRTESAVRLTDADFLPNPTFYEALDPDTGFPAAGAAALYDPTATAAVKRAILDHGAVAMSYFADVSKPDEERGNGEYFNYETWCQYVDVLSERTNVNHAVSVVGWDDHFSKSNFREGKQPPADGAWIVKNSWGATDRWAGADNSGCFYLSYYDRTICEFTSFRGEAEADWSYDHNYQYDYMSLAGETSITLKMTEPVGAANVYRAAGDEWLRAVSTVTNAPGSKVTVRVYRLEDGEEPCTGKPELTFTQTVQYAGYHTLELPEPLYLNQGERFAVAVSVLIEGGLYYLPVETGSNNEFVVQNAVCNPEESYLVDFVHRKSEDFTAEEGVVDFLLDYAEEQGEEITAGNAMIKAFTTNAEAGEVPTVTAGTGGTAQVSGNGTSVTVFPEEGYEPGMAFVNGEEVEIPWNDVLTGLKPGDTVQVEFVKAWANPFTDVKRNTWYYKNVRYAFENGLLLGTSETGFEPASPMTREMLVTVLYRAAGEPELSGPQGYPFADVDADGYYADAVYWARANGIVFGVGEERFGTGEYVTRQDLCCMLYRYAEFSGTDVSAAGDLSGFADSEKISGYAKAAVSWAVDRGILNGKENRRLDPLGSAQRCEVAAILQRFLTR